VPSFGISWADGIVAAGIAGVNFLNGAVNFNVQFGRCDSATENPQVRPRASNAGLYAAEA
jgi:hypothetical protein